ncbi:phosphatidate cytidylyltransferase [Paracoccus sediminicola]|uniref:phosphatidate cytidylyltransferase n=1 Tax=Paracoccus sediminicola TaxID=3017783 RepID=UPI0022F0D4C9|nr:phosphatidate cytidylyltransferase [Paracoccus sediminicola]WBU58104.1 phosphatidate cytidylyltransferase [Paracoccus sediminicola]
MAGSKWSDLTRRVVSAAVLLFIGVQLALSSGLALWAGVALFMALTFWELARMTGWRGPARIHTPFGRFRPMVLAVVAGLSLFAALGLPEFAPLILLLPIVAGLPGAVPKDRATYAIFGGAIMAVGYELVHLREEYGLPFILWLMGVVILSDVLGYFAGRMIGGPKFWPAVSPKKTWSGTLAGWIGAALFGAILWQAGLADWVLILLSPVVALAGQLGDIAESWLKRRAGVKDSSNLIPGHGGFMDRFDAVSGAVLAVMLLSWIMGLPQVGF